MAPDLDRAALDRWITGNWGEDAFRDACPLCEDEEIDGECPHEPPEDDPDRRRDEARDREAEYDETD